MSRSRKRYKKPEYSKRVVAVVLTFSIVVTLFSMVAMLYIRDLSALPTLITAVFAETGVVISFYLDKSKKENIAKGKTKREDDGEC